MKKTIKDIIIKAVYIALFSALLGLLVNAFHPFSVKIILKKEQCTIKIDDKLLKVTGKTISKTNDDPKVKPPVENATKEAEKAIEESPIVHIELKKTKELFDNGAVFLDARPEFRYIESHIKGSISLSASRFELQWKTVKDKIKPEDTIVIYCSSLTCHLSGYVAEYLQKKGFKNLYVFTAGWPCWVEANYPIEGLKVK